MKLRILLMLCIIFPLSAVFAQNGKTYLVKSPDYINFAAANKLEYIIIDEGWSDDHDLNISKPGVQAVVDYGKKKMWV